MIAQASLGNWLVVGSILVTIPYFYMFKQTMDSLSERDRARFGHEGALPVWRRTIAVLPLLIVVFSPDFRIKLVAAVWWFVQMFVDTRAHDRRLRQAGFDPVFCDRLQRISPVSCVGTLLFVAGVVLR